MSESFKAGDKFFIAENGLLPREMFLEDEKPYVPRCQSPSVRGLDLDTPARY